MESTKMSASRIIALQEHIIDYNATASIDDQLVLMIIGPPGVGKTAISMEAARRKTMPVYKSHPSVEDPTDTKGLPWPSAEKDSANFLPTGVISKLLKEKKPCLWLIDDFGQAPQSVQVAYMQWLWGKELNGHVLPHGVNITVCTNRMGDGAATFAIPEPVKSRVIIVELAFSLDDWCEWAMKADQPFEIIAFARFRSELFGQYKPTKDLVNQITPRTLARCGSLYKSNLPPDLQYDAYCGTIGPGAGTELKAFLDLFKDLPDPMEILMNPKAAKVPERADSKYAATAALMRHVTESTVENAFIYLSRFKTANGADNKEYEFMFAKSLVNTKQECMKTPAFMKWTTLNHKFL